MGKIFTEPKFPVVDKAPGFWQTGTFASLESVKHDLDSDIIVTIFQLETIPLGIGPS